MIKEKLARLQSTLQKQNLNGLILVNAGFHAADPLLYYLLLRTPEYAVLIIPQHGTPTLFAIRFEVTELRACYPEFSVQPLSQSIGTHIAEHLKGKRAAIHTKAIPTSLYTELLKKKIRLYEYTEADQVPSVKSNQEIIRLRQAADCSDKIFTALLTHWKKFKTEADVAHFILVATAEQGVEPSFPPIVASGKHASNPHYQPQNKKIQRGFCVIDMGVRFHGYCSDMTRTIYVGSPSEAERVLYQTLLEAQTGTMKKVKAGVSTTQLDEFCRQKLGRRLNKQFVHGLGHGLGTQVHEWPSVSKGQDVVLQENMVITIEPGVYKQGVYGIRIEDDVVVGKASAKILTKSQKELMIVGE